MPTRAVVPETQVQIRALRELANASARSAIICHTRRKMLLTTGDKLLVTVVGLLTCTALLWLWRSPGTSNVTGYAILASLLVAILWGTRFANMAKHVMVDRLGQREQNSLCQRSSKQPLSDDGREAEGDHDD